MKAHITFAIPFYQGLDYLRVAIESVLAQGDSGWLLIVCDDSGEDSGAESVVASFRDDRITYLRNESNLGMVSNWNRCLDEASTDLVNLLHGDDALLPNYMEQMIGLSRRHPEAAALYCEAEIIDSRGEPRFSFVDWIKGFLTPNEQHGTPGGVVILEGESGLRDLMGGYFIMTPTLCYRKSVLAGRRFADEWKQVQDLIFVSDLLLEGESVIGSREIAYAYRRHDASTTALQSSSMLRFDEEIRAFDRVADRAQALGWNDAADVARRKRIVRLHLLYRAMRELTRLRPAGSLRAFHRLVTMRSSLER